METTKVKERVEAQLAKLFSLLREVDESQIPDDMRHVIRFMVARLAELEIRIDGDKNHGRGHVHIKYENDNHAASYAIDNGSRLVGELPSGLYPVWMTPT